MGMADTHPVPSPVHPVIIKAAKGPSFLSSLHPSYTPLPQGPLPRERQGSQGSHLPRSGSRDAAT